MGRKLVLVDQTNHAIHVRFAIAIVYQQQLEEAGIFTAIHGVDIPNPAQVIQMILPEMGFTQSMVSSLIENTVVPFLVGLYPWLANLNLSGLSIHNLKAWITRLCRRIGGSYLSVMPGMTLEPYGSG
jgi:hypothetical protein